MIENTILWLCIIWMPLLIYFMLRNETKFKKNIAIGVTLPFEGRTHPDVLARLEKFKKQNLPLCPKAVKQANTIKILPHSKN